jgi:hypothetical protein
VLLVDELDRATATPAARLGAAVTKREDQARVEAASAELVDG